MLIWISCLLTVSLLKLNGVLEHTRFLILMCRTVCIQGGFLWFSNVLLLIIIGNNLSPKSNGTVTLPLRFIF